MKAKRLSVIIFLICFSFTPNRLNIYCQDLLSPPSFVEQISHYFIPFSWPGYVDNGKENWDLNKLRPNSWRKTCKRCPLCNVDQNNFRLLYYVNFSRLIKCGNCGLVFTDPQPNFDTIGGNYRYFESYRKPNGEQKVSQVLDHVIDLTHCIGNLKGKKILDLGCNSGLLLYGLWEYLGKTKKSLNNLYGVDTLIEALENGKREGLKHLYTNLNDLKGEKFDVIILSKTIEHFDNPISILRSLNDYLKPEGIVMILMVPNVDCIIRPYGVETSLLTAECAEHLFHFDIHTLSLLANKAGYDVNSVQFTNKKFGIYWGKNEGNQPEINHTFDVFARHFDVINRKYPLDDYSNVEYDQNEVLRKLEKQIRKNIHDIGIKYENQRGFTPIQIPQDAFNTPKKFLIFLNSIVSNPFYGTEFSLIIKPKHNNKSSFQKILSHIKNIYNRTNNVARSL